ncbi:MAG: hypothetical protein H0U23_07630 [Blastocatellia bacterium]|nr:hypothetical protein [Blastocatellia bacterium]
MALIVEDGSGVANANSFNTLAEIRAYATARGATLGTDEAVEVFAILAMDYLASLEPRLKGRRTLFSQELIFPREFVYYIGYLSYPGYPDDEIPPQIKSAQSQLVLEQHAGVPLMPTRVAQPTLIRRKVGPIEREWSPGGETITPYIPSVDALLFNFLNSGVFTLRSVRV